MVFPSDESILEAMCGYDKIYEYLHHRSYFLPDLSRIENQEFHMRLVEDVVSTNILPNNDVIETMHTDANSLLEKISIYTALLKEFHDAYGWSSLLSIDPYIVELGI